MSDQYNGPGFHLSLAKDDWQPPKLSAKALRYQAAEAARMEQWIKDNWVPCVKCGNKHPPEHGSHCIVCAIHTPLSEQRSYLKIGPKRPA